jgi:dUTPase
MIKFFIEPNYEVKAPIRDNGNAGVDFFIPNYSKAFVEAFKAKNAERNANLIKLDNEWVIRIESHGRVNIPSGIRSYISPNVALEAQNKSGIATKRGLVYGAATVDSSYRGIIHCSVINTTNKAEWLPLGMKLIQFIPRVIDPNDIEVHDDMTLEEFYADFEFDNRGEGAFGSTGV